MFGGWSATHQYVLLLLTCMKTTVMQAATCCYRLQLLWSIRDPASSCGLIVLCILLTEFDRQLHPALASVAWSTQALHAGTHAAAPTRQKKRVLDAHVPRPSIPKRHPRNPGHAYHVRAGQTQLAMARAARVFEVSAPVARTSNGVQVCARLDCTRRKEQHSQNAGCTSAHLPKLSLQVCHSATGQIATMHFIATHKQAFNAVTKGQKNHIHSADSCLSMRHPTCCSFPGARKCGSSCHIAVSAHC